MVFASQYNWCFILASIICLKQLSAEALFAFLLAIIELSFTTLTFLQDRKVRTRSPVALSIFLVIFLALVSAGLLYTGSESPGQMSLQAVD